MSVFRNFREAPGRRVFEGALFFIFLSAILITSGCAGVVSGNGGPGNQPTPQGAVTISNIQATAPTSSGFQVGWLTNVPADSQIDYGTSAAYGSTTPLSTTAVTVHHVTLSSLTTGTLYHYRVRSSDSKKNQALSGDFTFATSGDTTPPTVSITSPASGATLTGTVTVVANAQDNLSVASVQFKVDGDKQRSQSRCSALLIFAKYQFAVERESHPYCYGNRWCRQYRVECRGAVRRE